MIKYSKHLIRKTFRLLGLDIARIDKTPKQTLLGLQSLPIRTVIDVGANEGQFARRATGVFPEARFFCFEPLPEPFKKLDEWARKQKERNILVFQTALGEHEGRSEMHVHLEHSPSSSFLKSTTENETLYPFTQKQASLQVPMTTLDQWLRSRPSRLEPEILIKLDVQGYEDRVIRGGREAFGLAKACILEICLVPLYEGQATFNTILSLLGSVGYHYAGNLNQSYAENGRVIFIDAVFLK